MSWLSSQSCTINIVDVGEDSTGEGMRSSSSSSVWTEGD